MERYEKELNKTLISSGFMGGILAYFGEHIEKYSFGEILVLSVVFLCIIHMVYLVIVPKKRDIHMDFDKLFSGEYKPKNYFVYGAHKYLRLKKIYGNAQKYYEDIVTINKRIYIFLFVFLILILVFNLL